MDERARTTIAAIASPPGGGERGIVRLSGPRAKELARELVRFADGPLELAGRGFARGVLDDGRGEQPVWTIWMSAPRSYTGEDVIELHLPGSPPLLAAAFARCLEVGAEQARAGEFTRRAFENGRIDLAQAEGVLALVEAHDEGEARAARALLFGGLGERTRELRDRLEELRALCEASLDFSEDDTGDVAHGELATLARGARELLGRAIEWEARRSRPSGAPRIVLAGAPSAGKSALFNAWTSSRAIVGETAGTTRDPLRAAVRIGGHECELVDTAGVDRGRDEVERAAQELGRGEREAADVTLWVVDSADDGATTIARLREQAASLAPTAPRVLAWNKVDLDAARPAPAELAELSIARVVALSATRGIGLDRLRDALASVLDAELAAGRLGGLARELAARHLQALRECEGELDLALAGLDARASLDLIAHALRAATDALDAIFGRTTAEDLLDRIFARFCIGK